MPRRKPTSVKQKKADQKLKRAVKRGDAPPPEKERKPHPKKGAARRLNNINSTGYTDGTQQSSGLSSKRLASAFAKISPEFLALSRERAATEVLERPLSRRAAEFPLEDVEGLLNFNSEVGGKGKEGAALSCPKRPKWRFDMEKKEVEKNEEGQFARWLSETDATVDNWRRSPSHTNPYQSYSSTASTDDPHIKKESKKDQVGEQQPIFRPPTYFERNLEVWRQLWRVCELSQILLVLLDARCPLVHYPASLHHYLTSLRPARKIVLVLTKVDVVGLDRANAWERYLRERFFGSTRDAQTGGPDFRIVKTSSYKDQEESIQVQGRTRIPSLPSNFREDLLAALKKCHEELRTPPPPVQADPERLRKWVPRVPVNVSWDSDPTVPSDSITIPDETHGGDVHEGLQTPENGQTDAAAFTPPNVLTIGLIGQPNVGKSSLLNALFGERRVKASRTPGKTKHFQTLYLTPSIKLVDCPGLVFPALIPMEMQVLSAILPISQIPSIPSCMRFVLGHVPLERILGLAHPEPVAEGKGVDKRTWRDGSGRTKVGFEVDGEGTSRNWTTMDVLAAYALKNGWVTAKAGRPDVNRAGNALLRMLAEAKTKWGFCPPGSVQETKLHDDRDGAEGAGADGGGNAGESCKDALKEVIIPGDGIWIKGDLSVTIASLDPDHHEAESDEEDYVGGESSEEDGDEGEGIEQAQDDDDEEEEGSEEEGSPEDSASEAKEVVATGGRFGALSLEE